MSDRHVVAVDAFTVAASDLPAREAIRQRLEANGIYGAPPGMIRWRDLTRHVLMFSVPRITDPRRLLEAPEDPDHA